MNYEHVCDNLRNASGTDNNPNLIGNKKGRPMIDKNVIYDEFTDKIYDPDIDYEEYKKARK